VEHTRHQSHHGLRRQLLEQVLPITKKRGIYDRLAAASWLLSVVG
jgi:hypothetical protein